MLTRLKFLTAGESHGQGLLGILDGIPSGLEINRDYIDFQLKRRQMGHGRGGRMKIENDKAEMWSGVRHGKNHRLTYRLNSKKQRLGKLVKQNVSRTSR